VALSHQASACPSGAGLQFHTSWSLAEPEVQGVCGGDPVVPLVAGAQQGLKGGGLKGWVSWWVVGPAWDWGLVRPGGGDTSGRGSGAGLWYGAAKGWVSLCGVGLSRCWGLVQLRGGYPGGVWIWRRLRGWDPTVCVSGTGLWSGAAQGAESPAEWSCSSASLQCRDLVGWPFFC
jgi:hypothetical protein